MYKKITTLSKAYKAHPEHKAILNAIEVIKSIPESLSRGMLAMLNLQVTCYVINNDDPALGIYEPDFNDSNTTKYSPWCIGGDSSGSGFRFDEFVNGWTNTTYVGGARLALRDQARCNHMKEYFPDLYKEFYLILKPKVEAKKKK